MKGNFSLLIGLFVVCAMLVILRPLASRIGLLDKPGGRKDHDGEIPLIGGIAMFCGFLFAVLSLDTPLSEFRPLFAGCALLIIVGVLDDLRELPAWARFAAQICAALMMTLWGGVVVEDLGALLGTGEILLGPLAVPFTVFGVIGVINAVNMFDGIDGLAGSMSFLLFGLLGFLASLSGQAAMANLLFILAATSFGFLCFNMRIPGRKRALAFMGDAGSMFLGFAIAWFLVALSQKPGNAFEPVTALWLFALPLLDTVSIMLRRILKGQSPFAADRDHLHHILLRAGYSPSESVLVITTLAMLLAGAGILGAYAQLPEGAMFYGFLTLFGLYFWGMKHAWKLMRVLPHPRMRLVRARQQDETETAGTATNTRNAA